MGLLDDAIREHMELKRLRGADPGEVAQQERDALGPVGREHEPDEPGAFEDEEHGDHDDGVPRPPHHAHLDRHDVDHADPAAGSGAHDDDDPSIDPHPEREPDFANVGQETAELDMRTVLDGQPEDEFEEAPAISVDTPGQERLWFDQQQAPRDFDFDP